ncbi:MAG: hypothetical protein GX654_06400 [Desulfatiglans sp.]|nr:hypothetical protein [Desulfatiglans sp.]
MKISVMTSILLLVAGLAFGAGIDGKWAGTFDSGMGGAPMELSYDFKADGNKLTGTTVGAENSTIDIQNGTIDGSKITFDVPVDMGGMKMTVAYTGELAGDELKLSFSMKMEGAPEGAGAPPGGGEMPPMSFVAKRVK